MVGIAMFVIGFAIGVLIGDVALSTVLGFSFFTKFENRDRKENK